MALWWWFSKPSVRFAIFQIAIVAVAGALISGTVLLIATRRGILLPILLTLLVLAPFGVMVVGGTGTLRKFLLALILIEIPIQIDYHIAWSQYWAHLGAVAGFNISITTFCLIFLYLWWFVDILSKRVAAPPRAFFVASLPSLAYIAVSALSALVARDVTYVFYGLNIIVQSFLLFFYVMNFTRTREDVKFIFIILLINLLLQGLVSGVTGGSGISVASTSLTPESRLSGTFTSPNVAGAYMAMALLSVFSLLAAPIEARYKGMAAFAIGAGGFAIMTTASRGAWSSLAVTVVLLAVLTWRKGWLSLKLPIAYTVIALGILAAFHEPLLHRLSAEQAASSAEARGYLTVIATRMIQDHPLFGVGLNNYALAMMEYITSEFAGLWLYAVHNKYLLVWAETGIVGLIAFLWFLLATLYRGWQVWRRSDRLLSPLALAFTLTIVAWMIHMTVELFSGRPQLMMLWFIAGAITAMDFIERGQN